MNNMEQEKGVPHVFVKRNRTTIPNFADVVNDKLHCQHHNNTLNSPTHAFLLLYFNVALMFSKPFPFTPGYSTFWERRLFKRAMIFIHDSARIMQIV